MNEILSKYLSIIEVPKWERKKRNELLQNWNEQKLTELPSYKELKEFESFCEAEGHRFDTYFFMKKIYIPVYYNEIFSKKNIDALMRIYDNYSSTFFFSNQARESLKTEPVDLLQLGLEIDPKNKRLLKDKYNRYIGGFENDIHEVPWIVIFGQNSASIEETELLLNKIKDFKLFCLENDFDIPEIKIKKYEFYFNTWKTYLKDFVKKMDYETYLSNHKLSEWIKIMKSEPENLKTYEFLLSKYES